MHALSSSALCDLARTRQFAERAGCKTVITKQVTKHGTYALISVLADGRARRLSDSQATLDGLRLRSQQIRGTR